MRSQAEKALCGELVVNVSHVPCWSGVGAPTHVSLPHVPESSLARENNWLIFLFRDALFQSLTSSLTIFYGIKCNKCPQVLRITHYN